MATATYRRVAPSPVISVNVTKDGDVVPPTFTVHVALADEGQFVGNLRETALHIQQDGAGTVDVPIAKVLQIAKVAGRLMLTLKDKDAMANRLLGPYHLELWEGTLTLDGGARLASLTVATSATTPGVITRSNPKDGAVMVYVPAGEFLMGSTDGKVNDNERPQHKVYLTGYWMYKCPVTVAQYRKYCHATGRQMPEQPVWSQDDHPIVNVNWHDAADYAHWAGVALPTEAQWEKAARGTDGRVYPWGNDWDSAKCVNATGGTKPVGSCSAGASPYGALDMAGNVWQWCADWYAADYYRKAPATIHAARRRGQRGCCAAVLLNYPGYFRVHLPRQPHPDAPLRPLRVPLCAPFAGTFLILCRSRFGFGRG